MLWNKTEAILFYKVCKATYMKVITSMQMQVEEDLDIGVCMFPIYYFICYDNK